eukprot:CAMPEP_0116065058 /NCGR_PEP_ID=MMETSP0322-20121206/9498_1 /TAXON_ID=163516 /ORGANISM="Leptocylindrus danicus var. apora, Strain B651" /LENGTH=362 /DNA_ID=CAMNT_0003551223 /DNA_START=111 /DNA_END=1199 /DNA_ORIENTATION=+
MTISSNNIILLLIIVGCYGTLALTSLSSERMLLSPLHRRCTSSSMTRLFARSRKDMFRELQEGGTVEKKSKKGEKDFYIKKKRNTGKRPAKVGSNSGGAVSISPDLAQWAGTLGDDNAVMEEGGVASAAESNTSKNRTRRRSKKEEKEEKKLRQMQRKAEEEAIAERVAGIVEVLEEKFEEEKRDMNFIVENLENLCNLGGTGTRTITSGQTRVDYRMVFAGSDAAVCHLGSGLHKVPLARLQEIFMTVGKNRIEVNEVIRILGPFPNVRNILKGDTSVASSNKFNIEYTSMVDGTGKEILAGKEENKRNVQLNVMFASDPAIVCSLPIESGENPFDNNGQNILVFFKEENLDEELEKLRVL